MKGAGRPRFALLNLIIHDCQELAGLGAQAEGLAVLGEELDEHGGRLGRRVPGGDLEQAAALFTQHGDLFFAKRRDSWPNAPAQLRHRDGFRSMALNPCHFLAIDCCRDCEKNAAPKWPGRAMIDKPSTPARRASARKGLPLAK